jgi:Fe2+ or Zn2+ uptake regulation protein
MKLFIGGGGGCEGVNKVCRERNYIFTPIRMEILKLLTRAFLSNYAHNFSKEIKKKKMNMQVLVQSG